MLDAHQTTPRVDASLSGSWGPDKGSKHLYATNPNEPLLLFLPVLTVDIGLFHQTAFSTTMTRLSAGTWPAPCKASGRRSGSCAKTDSQLWRGPPVPVPPALSRGTLTTLARPACCPVTAHPELGTNPAIGLPSPSRTTHCPVDGVPGGASGCASQSAAWTFQHFPPAQGPAALSPPCSHPSPSCPLPTARPHAPPIPLLRDICARIAAFAFAFSPTTPAFSVASL